MTITTFNKPPEDRYFEDYEVGATYELGSFSLSAADIVAFARQYDPQWFHTDPAAAQDSIYGGLIASGWHTGCSVMRLIVEGYVSRVASLGSPGIDELRWPRPVRPGDIVTARVTVEKTRVSKSKPDRGLVHSCCELVNQHGETVMLMRSANFILRRNPH